MSSTQRMDQPPWKTPQPISSQSGRRNAAGRSQRKKACRNHMIRSYDDTRPCGPVFAESGRGTARAGSGRMETTRGNPMIELRTPAEIDEMRAAGRFVAETLATLRDETKVGTNLLSIDRRAHDMIRKAGAESCYIDYHPSFGASPFGKVICTRSTTPCCTASPMTTHCVTATSSPSTSQCRSTVGSPTRRCRSSSARLVKKTFDSSVPPNAP